MAIKTLFVGSNWEALETLKALVADKRFDIIGVITQPDKPVGRKQEILPTEIKMYCNEIGIKVFHTEGKEEKYKEALEIFKPELIVCKSFGEIVPGFFIDYPKYSAINVHYSLLPKYRGAVPIQKAILEGEKTTGITIVQMVEKLDAGPILAQFEDPINPDDTNQTLRERLVCLNKGVLPDILIKWCNGAIKAIEQDDDLATFCWQKDISKENAEINFNKTDPVIAERMVRAMQPWPIAWTMFEGKRMKIFQAQISKSKIQKNAEKNYTIDNGKLLFKTVNQEIMFEVLELQIEGKNKVSAKEFVNGIRPPVSPKSKIQNPK